MNPGPLAPKARIIPLDQQATHTLKAEYDLKFLTKDSISLCNRDEMQQLLPTLIGDWFVLYIIQRLKLGPVRDLNPGPLAP